MVCPNRPHYHYAIAPWRQADIAQQDFEPAYGTLQRDHRAFAQRERHFAMPVVGQSGLHDGPMLGVLAVRCELHQGWVMPTKLAIADPDVAATIEATMASVQGA